MEPSYSEVTMSPGQSGAPSAWQEDGAAAAKSGTVRTPNREHPLPGNRHPWIRGQRVHGFWGQASGQECCLGADCGGYGAESSRVKRREGRIAGDDCDAFGAARSDQKRPGPQLWRHQPDQIPRERFFRCSAGEVLFFRGLERHHPAGMINRPGARVGDRPLPGRPHRSVADITSPRCGLFGTIMSH